MTYTNERLERELKRIRVFTIPQLQASLGVGYMQIRECVRSLEERGLVSLGEDQLTYTYKSTLGKVKDDKEAKRPSLFERFTKISADRREQQEREILEKLYNELPIEITESADKTETYELKVNDIPLLLSYKNNSFIISDGGNIDYMFDDFLKLSTSEGEAIMNVFLKKHPLISTIENGVLGNRNVIPSSAVAVARNLVELYKEIDKAIASGCELYPFFAETSASNLTRALQLLIINMPDDSREEIISYLDGMLRHDDDDDALSADMHLGYKLMLAQLQEMTDNDFNIIARSAKQPRYNRFKRKIK